MISIDLDLTENCFVPGRVE